MPKPVMFLAFLLPLSLGIFVTDTQLNHATAQSAGTLDQIVPGYYVYNSAPRISGVIVTNEGVVVVDALSNEAMATHERQLISEVIGQPVRYLISSSFHDNYTRGNVAYQDVVSIGHEDYSADLPANQEDRLPDLTYRERMTLRVGNKVIEIIHVGPAHTRGDSIVFVPQDRIVFTSEVFFYDRFPFFRSGSLNWINAIDIILNLEADIIVPGNGDWPVASPEETRQALLLHRQILVEARDAVQQEIAQGATEDEVAERVLLKQYEGMIGYNLFGGGILSQREVMVRRIYQELTGTLE